MWWILGYLNQHRMYLVSILNFFFCNTSNSFSLLTNTFLVPFERDLFWHRKRYRKFVYILLQSVQGRIQDFKLGGAYLKNLRRAREARKLLGYFVWKITILRQKILFFPIAEGGANIFGVFRVKNHDFTPKNHIYFQF
jgi:hypothetical protein